MKQLKQQIDDILPLVQKPARYTGNELNSIRKDWATVGTKIALAFPDVYEIAMSFLGFQILYGVINEHEDALAERVYAPWIDLETLMRENHIPLFSLETHRPAQDFDFIGFTLQYEMSYSNILNMLDLAGVSLLQSERRDNEPFVMAGGPCAFNPEPLADFFDFFVLGEAEVVILEVVAAHKAWRKEKGSRQNFLQQVARIPGVYVPSFYQVTYDAQGLIHHVEPQHESIPSKITKRIVKDLDAAPYPTAPIVPNVEAVHDRISLEIFRGCTRGCRFCQAGSVYRPVREKSLERLKQQAQALVKNTGYDEISLSSLSTSDYSAIQELIGDLNCCLSSQGVGISLPSLRTDTYSIELAKEVQKVRKSGLTLAPEAGSQRLRDVINKQVCANDLYAAVAAAYAEGWKRVKLYFMIGLPTETYQDLDGIVEMAHKVSTIGDRPLKVTVSTASFVPKPHTPFQWVPQLSRVELEKRQGYLLEKFRKHRHVKYNYHEADVSWLEAVFARGDRRLGSVLAIAHQLGCKYDGWDEHFDFSAWMKAFDIAGIDPAFYANRHRSYDEVLPWAHLDSGVSSTFLRKESEAALQGQTTPDCRWDKCSVCGVCPELEVKTFMVKG